METRYFPSETVQIIEQDINIIIDSFQVPEPNPHTKEIFNKAKHLHQQSPIEEPLKQFKSTNYEQDQQEEEIQLLFTNLDTGLSSTLSLKEVNQVNQNCFSKTNSLKQSSSESGSKIEGAWYDFWKKVYTLNEQLRMNCQKGNINYLYKLFSQKSSDYPIDLNSRGFDEWSPLHYASYENHYEIVKLLIENNADIKAETKFGKTALHIGCLRGNLEIVKLLVEMGSDVDRKDGDGKTAKDLAVENQYQEIAKYLEEKGKQKGEIDKKEVEGENQSPVKKEKKFGLLLETYNSPTNNRKLLKSMELTSDSFVYHKLLGSGSFGQVFLVSPKGASDYSEVYAMKVLKKQQIYSRNLTKYVYAERNVLSTMNHPFIVKLHSSFQSETKLFLIMDYCPGSDLGKILIKKKKFPQDTVRMYIAELVLALEALHKNMIIYRDLKPDNVVLDAEGHIKLTDFGLSKEGIYNNSTESFCGSIAYLAPDILNKQGHTRMVDWYLLGVMTYELLTGLPPYYATEREQLYENIKKGVLRIPKAMSSTAKDFIMKLLKRDYKGRMGFARDASEVKEHEFFEGIDWRAVINKELPVPPVQGAKVNLKETIKVDFSGKKDDKGKGKLDRWTYINDM